MQELEIPVIEQIDQSKELQRFWLSISQMLSMTADCLEKSRITISALLPTYSILNRI